jgi:amidase
MKVSEYIELDGTDLAHLVSTKQVKSEELADVAIAAIESVNDQLNALAGPLFDPPLSHSRSGPFGGVPFGIKDLGLTAEGVRQVAASQLLLRAAPATRDSDLMTRFREAGLATVALTTCPELGFNSNTGSRLVGSTSNPWDPSRSAGGSSGGSSALVASRALPIAHANDGGGSIRIPASYCGLVGLKPSRGRITTGPDHGDWIMGMAIEFVVSRTVRDSAGVFDAVHGSTLGERFVLPQPELSLGRAARDGLGDRKLRIAVLDHRFNGGDIDERNRTAVHEVAKVLEDMGHIVEWDAPTFDQAAYDEAALKSWSSYLGYLVDDITATEGITATLENAQQATLACADYGKSFPASKMHAVEFIYNRITRDVAKFFTQYDVLLSPTTAYPNIPLGQINQDDPSHTAHTWYNAVFEPCPFTQLFNVTGNPAITLPLTESDNGWPIGMQFAGKYLDEKTLFQLSGDLEQAMPWAGRRPRVIAS